MKGYSQPIFALVLLFSCTAPRVLFCSDKYPTVNVMNAGRPAIASAALAKDTAAIKELLGSGGNIDEEDRDGQTALMLVVQRGDLETVKFLVENGANVNHVSRRFGNSLYWANKRAHAEPWTSIAEYLKEKGAKNIVKPDGL